MPLFMCRWENGDCSFVAAPSKDVAIEYLDEIGNAEGSLVTAIRDFMVHFELTPEGKLQFQSFGEAVEQTVREKAYPAIDALLHSDKLSGEEEGTPCDLELIGAAVATERQHLQGKNPHRLAQTEDGRRVAAEMDAPAALVDHMVRQMAGWGSQ